MTRTRSISDVDPEATVSFTSYQASGKVSDGPPVWGNSKNLDRVYTPRSWVKTMTDVVTENFYKKRAQGAIINNPMLSSTVELTCTPSAYSRCFCGIVNGVWTGTKYEGVNRPTSALCGGWMDEPDVGKDSLIDQAVTDSFAKINLSEAQILNTLAEADKSVISLVAILQRVLRIAKYVKKLQVKALLGEIKPKALAERYMEIRYALRPLMYDARQITAAVACEAKKADRFTFRGFKSRTSSDDDSITASTDTNTVWRANRHAERTVEVRSGVLCKIEALSKLNTWGVDQPIETIWEITPFSFIFDWFWNTGKIIASWTPEMGIRTLASWYVVSDSTYYENCCCGSTNDTSIQDAINYLDLSCSMSQLSVVKERVADPSRSFLPRFNLRLDALKLLDLAIIGKQLLQK